MIMGRATTYSGLKRRESFMKRLEHHGLTMDVRYMIKGDFTGKTDTGDRKSDQQPSAAYRHDSIQ